MHPPRTDNPTTAAPQPRSAATPSAVPGASTTTDSGPYGGTAEARRQWEPTVQGFALAYPDTGGLTRKQWLANLRPYLERPVLDALAITDLSKVPRGHYGGYQLLKAADEAITIRITYQEGWALVLYLAANGDDDTWSITSFDSAIDFD